MAAAFAELGPIVVLRGAFWACHSHSSHPPEALVFLFVGAFESIHLTGTDHNHSSVKVFLRSTSVAPHDQGNPLGARRISGVPPKVCHHPPAGENRSTRSVMMPSMPSSSRRSAAHSSFTV